MSWLMVVARVVRILRVVPVLIGAVVATLADAGLLDGAIVDALRTALAP